MEIKVFENDDKTVYHNFRFTQTIINFILFKYITRLMAVLWIIYFGIGKSLEAWDRVFLLLFIVVFLILWIKQSYGDFTEIYNIFIKQRWLSPILGNLHGFLLIAFFVITLVSKGENISSSLLYIGTGMFYTSIIITLYFYFISMRTKKKDGNKKD